MHHALVLAGGLFVTRVFVMRFLIGTINEMMILLQGVARKWQVIALPRSDGVRFKGELESSLRRTHPIVKRDRIYLVLWLA